MGGSRFYLVVSTTTEKRKALRASCWRLVSFWRKEVGRRSCGLAAVESVKALGTKNALQCADATRFAWAVEARARLQRVVSSESALRGLGDSPGCKGLALLLVVVECVVAAKTNDEVGKTEWLNMGLRVAATRASGASFLGACTSSLQHHTNTSNASWHVETVAMLESIYKSISKDGTPGGTSCTPYPTADY